MYENDWMLWQLAQERQRDLLRQIERERLVRQAQLGRPQGHAFYHLLDWTGRRLVRWGEHLQARHAVHHTPALARAQEVNH